ncbi:MAG: hypothetical protein IPO25_21450 [Saprospiraceae bacterium]|nr:hypothetical protein [Saprospiraceae bacterium]
MGIVIIHFVQEQKQHPYFSLSGGAQFSGASANDAVSTSGDWEGRFTWCYSLRVKQY